MAWVIETNFENIVYRKKWKSSFVKKLQDYKLNCMFKEKSRCVGTFSKGQESFRQSML